MKIIKVYATSDARKAIRRKKNPADVSLRKWDSIRDAIIKLEELATGDCGICLAAMKKHIDCDGCIVKKVDRKRCNHDSSPVQKFRSKLVAARVSIDGINDMLEKVKDFEASQTEKRKEKEQKLREAEEIECEASYY